MPTPEIPLSLALLLVPVVVLIVWAAIVGTLTWFGRRRARRAAAPRSADPSAGFARRETLVV